MEELKSLKSQCKWPKLLGRQNIAFWTNTVSHLHHEIKAVNIWLVFIRLIALKKIKYYPKPLNFSPPKNGLFLLKFSKL